MTDTVDTSAEAVKLVLGYLRGPRGRGTSARIHHDILDDIVPKVLGLLAERDTLRAERDVLYRQAAEYTYIGKDGKAVLAKDLEDERDALLDTHTDKADAWDVMAKKNATIATLRKELAGARNAALDEAADIYLDIEVDTANWISVYHEVLAAYKRAIRALKTNGGNENG